jgi:hypothetical protein
MNRFGNDHSRNTRSGSETYTIISMDNSDPSRFYIETNDYVMQLALEIDGVVLIETNGYLIKRYALEKDQLEKILMEPSTQWASNLGSRSILH